MAPRDLSFGMDNAGSEPFVDVVLILTACSFTLLVGIIIGYYVEVFFKRQKFLGNLVEAPSTLRTDDIIEKETGLLESGSGVSMNISQSPLKSQYSTTTHSTADAKYLGTKPSKVNSNLVSLSLLCIFDYNN